MNPQQPRGPHRDHQPAGAPRDTTDDPTADGPPFAGRFRHGRGTGGGFGGGRGGRRGWRGGGWQQADLPPADDAAAWLVGRLPGGWFVGPPQVEVDREEITVLGELSPVDGDSSSAAAAGRIDRFRQETREERMAIDLEAQARYGRSLAWGARIGDVEQRFTSLSVPVMTRLRQPDRRVLDTLVDAGVARSRSDALAWCVRLVGEHADEWLAKLRQAMADVDRLRGQGPGL